MEEKHRGQAPEADRPADDPLQGRAARAGGRAKGGLDPTAQDLALVRDADRRSKAAEEALAQGGFGDHKGVDGFPTLDRTE